MTLLRNLKGMTSRNGNLPRPGKVVARFTSDNIGESLSLEAGGVMIFVDYADIAKMVERERAQGYKDGHLIIDEGDKWE